MSPSMVHHGQAAHIWRIVNWSSMPRSGASRALRSETAPTARAALPGMDQPPTFGGKYSLNFHARCLILVDTHRPTGRTTPTSRFAPACWKYRVIASYPSTWGSRSFGFPEIWGTSVVNKWVFIEFIEWCAVSIARILDLLNPNLFVRTPLLWMLKVTRSEANA